jgi:hypothetical protein
MFPKPFVVLLGIKTKKGLDELFHRKPLGETFSTDNNWTWLTQRPHRPFPLQPARIEKLLRSSDLLLVLSGREVEHL